MKTFDGYSKEKFSDTSVLLAGGGSKELSNFIGTLNWDSTNRKLQYKKIGDTNWSDLVTFGSNATNSTAYLPLAGGTMTGSITINTDSEIRWSRNTNYSRIHFKNLSDSDTDSYMGFETGDNGNEYFRFAGKSGSTVTLWMSIKADGVRANTFIGSLTGNASSATKLTSSAGSAVLPIYFSDGKPIACTAYSELLTALNSSVDTNLSITVGGTTKSITNLYSGYLKIHDIRGTAHAPNATYYPGKLITAWVNSTGTPSDDWFSGIHVKGWSNGYTSWELCSYSSTGTANNYNLYFRSGNNTTWGSWKTILDSSNYSSYALPLSGGSLTGLIIGNNKGGAMIEGRSNAALYLSRNITSDWHPVIGFKTKTGSWEFGSIGDDDHALFSWGSDSNYNSYTNDATIVRLRNISGTIALTSDIPTVTNYYWANIPISATSSTTTDPTFRYPTSVYSKFTNGSEIIGYVGKGGSSDTLGFGNYKNADVNIYTDNTLSKCIYLKTGGNVGIGTTNPSYKLHVVGNAAATHFYENSDIRFKTNFSSIDISINQLSEIPLFDFDWVDNNLNRNTGTSAQAVQEILPYIVSGTDKLTLDYGVLGTIAGITACKELVNLKSEIDLLKERIELLELQLKMINDYGRC